MEPGTWFYFICVLSLTIIVKDHNGTLEPALNKFEERIGIRTEVDTTKEDVPPPYYINPFDEEKNVAEKAPVLEIGIKDLSDNKTAKVKKPEISIFKYVIKLGDFYFYDSAMSLKQRVKNEFKVNEVKINKLSKTKFRVYLGPYDNLNSLKNAFNKISILNFENIEIIKI